MHPAQQPQRTGLVRSAFGGGHPRVPSRSRRVPTQRTAVPIAARRPRPSPTAVLVSREDLQACVRRSRRARVGRASRRNWRTGVAGAVNASAADAVEELVAPGQLKLVGGRRKLDPDLVTCADQASARARVACSRTRSYRPTPMEPRPRRSRTARRGLPLKRDRTCRARATRERGWS